MSAFLKSDLFFRFLGGFVLGAVGMFVLHPSEPVITPPAIAATASASSMSVSDHAAL